MHDELTRLCRNRDATVARITRLEQSRAAKPQLDEQREHLDDVLAQIAQLQRG